MRNAAFSTLGDNNLADGIVEGTSPTFTVTRPKTNRTRRNRASRQGHRRGAVLPVPELRARRDDAAGPRRHADPERRLAGQLRLHHARARRRPAAGESARPSLYGHGLFGDASEVASGPQRSLSQAHDIVQCATDEIGMSESDVPSAVPALQNLSAFPKITDRLQQGLLDELYLGRAMISPSGFTSDAAFHQDGTLARRRC